MAIDSMLASKGVGLTKPLGKLAGGGADPLGGAPADKGGSFLDMVAEAGKGAVQSGKIEERTAAQGLAKTADLVDVVTATSNAELTLQTVVTIRDRVIQAYQDIIRMPV